jgi:hypothetical protein
VLAGNRVGAQDGTSINPFVAMAVAEKVSALETATFFEDRKARAGFKAFDRIMRRRAGEPPREGYETPESNALVRWCNRIAEHGVTAGKSAKPKGLGF